MQRRQVLLAKIAGQREQMAGLVTRWQPALNFADRTLALVRFLRTNAVLVAGLAGLAVVRRNGVSVLLKGAWRVWKTYRYFNELSKKITASR